MLALPAPQLLIQDVRDGLDAVTAKHRSDPILKGTWFPTITSEIAMRLKRRHPNLECYYNKGTAPVCDGKEWNNLDFLSLVREERDSLPIQAVVVGEIEISTDNWEEIDYDFEKVLIVDSLLFFMVSMQYSRKDADKILTHLETAARRRQDYARMRGNTPPAFLLSCWVEDASRFEHRSG